ncbi:hypothetical protein, variant 1 [Cryptococcus amylolentus CBS 6039]|uniref:Xylose isomerase-like TIM barrel domain-containing protein n=1 Tax=Cryptococcus amylolentus CBS 6039 TaxID=1295533 RepID=A0A1E3HIZ5_9TREE|nr:hypothetical protein L202_06247 [Cryptococcus amylolentus CBS 6039]XP_018991853.1 hypothetical protein, variant 1 [Cryptococcus amylolentus CBS 6039]ODN76321.1 hypothetical protein L202_06247 [Cryptococcus amylolentus CBS 6039]ODN76322.1 hypothetical protein, variant 1 [Cryptococcus amylolentus CBS 6039]
MPAPESSSPTGFSWLDIFDDLPSQSPHIPPPTPSPLSLPASPPSRTSAGQGHAAFAQSELWEDGCLPSGTSSCSTGADNRLSLASQCLLPAAAVAPLTPPLGLAAFPSTPASSIPALSYSNSPGSPGNIIQTPRVCHSLLEPIMADPDDNPFVAFKSHGEQDGPPVVARPKRPHPPTFQLPQDWVTDTPTPIRFHADTCDIPERPIFPPPTVPIARADEPEDVNVGLRWLAHMPSSGGLLPSIARLRESMEDAPIVWSNILGISTYINNPKRRVCCAPTQSTAPAPSADCSAFQSEMDELMEDWRETSMVHGVYTVNLLSSDPEVLERSKVSVIEEMRQARDLGFRALIIHLGSEGQGVKSSSHRHQTLLRLIPTLQNIISSVPDVTLALENTCHSSPSSLTNLASIIEILTHFPPSRLKLCLDLSHLYVNELDLNEVEGRNAMWELLDRVGWKRVVGVHVSDNHVEHGGKGDRHANIGCGHITPSSFRSILSQPFFKTVPLLLESPPYFKNFVVPSESIRRMPRYATQIITLEHERSALERGIIECMIHLSDDEWYEEEVCLWATYNGMRKAVERKIYNIVKKQGGGIWKSFSKGRKKVVEQLRATEGAKRKKKNSAKR